MLKQDAHNQPEHERAAQRRAAENTATTPETAATQHPLLAMQRQVGNARVARMLAQRELLPEEEQEDAGILQAMPEVGLAGGPVSPGIEAQINAQRGAGSALEPQTQATMEQSFGTNFAAVRVHTGSEAQQLNQNISARAFTTGNDIFLGQGASSHDHSLLAHELTHVVQQRSMATSGPLTVGPADDSYEQEADAVAARVTSGATTTAATNSEAETEDS